MIRLFFFFLIALSIGGIAAVWLGDDYGYILVNFNGYAIETTVVALVLMLLLGFVAFYLLLWIIARLNPWHLVKNKSGIFLTHGQATAGTEKGMVMLAEQRYQDAYRLLLENARKSPTPLGNYLGAAEAAFQLDDEKGVRFCLKKAESYTRNSKDAAIANGMLTARLEQKAGRLEDATAHLRSLQIKHPKHGGVLGLLAELYNSVGAWTELAALLPLIKKQHILSEKAYAALEIKVYRGRLQNFNPATGQVSQLESLWESTPKTLQNDEVALGTYIHKLVEMGSFDRAQGVLMRFFKNSWSDSLIIMLGYLDTTEPAQLLVFLEKLVKERPGHAVLALTLGRVSLRNRLWGKGREYFESALRFSTDDKISAEVNAELARLYEALGEYDRSVVCYKKALHMLDRKLPELPFPG